MKAGSFKSYLHFIKIEWVVFEKQQKCNAHILLTTAVHCHGEFIRLNIMGTIEVACTIFVQQLSFFLLWFSYVVDHEFINNISRRLLQCEHHSVKHLKHYDRGFIALNYMLPNNAQNENVYDFGQGKRIIYLYATVAWLLVALMLY